MQVLILQDTKTDSDNNEDYRVISIYGKFFLEKKFQAKQEYSVPMWNQGVSEKGSFTSNIRTIQTTMQPETWVKFFGSFFFFSGGEGNW